MATQVDRLLANPTITLDVTWDTVLLLATAYTCTNNSGTTFSVAFTALGSAVSAHTFPTGTSTWSLSGAGRIPWNDPVKLMVARLG